MLVSTVHSSFAQEWIANHVFQLCSTPLLVARKALLVRSIDGLFPLQLDYLTISQHLLVSPLVGSSRCIATLAVYYIYLIVAFECLLVSESGWRGALVSLLMIL